MTEAEIAKYNAELKEVAKRADMWHREAEMNAAEIIRLQADKEALIAGQETLQKALAEKKAELKETTEKFNCQQIVYADLSDIIRDKNAEIEKLQADNSSMQSTLAKMSMGVEQAKAEAIKEFAERLKKTFPQDDFLRSTKRISEDIDNLVKEMGRDKE